MRGSIPWRAGREKDPILLQTLIESTTRLGDIVLDCTASTSMDFLQISAFTVFIFFSFTIPYLIVDLIQELLSMLVGRPPFCGHGG